METNKSILVVTVAILATAAILLGQSTLSVMAENTKQQEAVQIGPNEVQTTAETETDLSNSRKIEQAQAETNEDVITKAREIIGKAEKAYLTPGWLHITSSTQAFVTAQQTLPDGTPIPTQWTDETWILLDEQGDAIQAVTIQDTGNPKLLQISVYENGSWTNLSMGIGDEPEKYHPTLDGGILQSANNYKDTLKFSMEEIALNGQQALVFAVEENLKSPISEGNNTVEGQQINGMVNKYYFAASSGLPIQTEDYKINSTSQLEIIKRIVIHRIEKTSTPPASILAYFTK